MRLPLLVLLALALPLYAAKDKPRAKQPSVKQGCITVKDIRSHERGRTTKPGIEGTVENGCTELVHITLTVAYYDRKGVKFASGTETGTVAAGTSWRFYHVPTSEAHRSLLASATIINVTLSQP